MLLYSEYYHTVMYISTADAPTWFILVVYKSQIVFEHYCTKKLPHQS